MKNLIKELNHFTHKIDSAFKIPHFHNGYELIYVVEGTVLIEINDARHNITAPAIVLLNPFESHRVVRSGNDYRRYMIVADSDILEREVNPKIISTIKCRPNGFKHVVPLDAETVFFIDRIFAVLEKEYQKEYLCKDKMIANEIYNLLILIYRLCGANNASYNENMMLVQLYIDENYREIKNVADVAKKFFISPEHLSRAFKIYSGYTPVEYLIRTRLYHAQLLLIGSSLNVTQICVSVGFRDINNFIRQFRLKYGMSLTTFRKQQHAHANNRT